MNNKNVLIIGASSGLGRAVALQYAKEGAHVIVSSRTSTALTSLKLQIENSGGSCHVHPCDICSEDAVQRLITDSIERFGHIDIAVLSSAVQYIDRIDQLDTSEVDAMFQTNVVGIIRCTRHLLPHMKQRQSGHIVLISSIMGEAAFPQMVSYGATKAAISCFARGLQREVSFYGIDVTLVSPGHMNTNLSTHLKDRVPHWYGKSGSLNINEVAEKMIRAIKKKHTETIIGRQSKALSRLIKYLPSVANRIIRKITTSS